jgi:membrane protease YdiL (CAAX protease family)
LVKKLLGGLLLYLAAVLVLAAVLTPVGFWVCSVLFQWDVPVRRVFNRCLILAALPLLWPLMKFWGFQGWKQMGWSGKGGTALAKDFGVGLSLGLGVMGSLVILALGLGERSLLSWESLSLGWKLAGFLAGAVLVGLVEETIFRGAFFLGLLGVLKNRIWPWAVANSIFFASVHYFKAVNPSGEAGLTVGFRILSEMAWTAWIAPDALPRWLTLFFFGLVLCALAYRRGVLGMAAGFHAGAVFMMKLGQHITVEVNPGGGRWFDADLITGWAPLFLLWILLTAILLTGHKKGRVERAL